MNPPVTSIDDLPPEMICELFEYLPPKELVVCSMVNKRWHSIYATFKVHSLVVSGSSPSRDFKWYYLNQPFREAERCSEVIFCRLAEKPLLSNLRYLALDGFKFEFNLNELNRFKQLVHLEINGRFDGMNLKSPKLKFLAYHKLHTSGALSIDCPELSTMYYYAWDVSLLKERQSTIRKLVTKLVTNLAGARQAPFKSVKCLVISTFEAISKAILLSLPKLTELRYNKDIDCLVEEEFDNGVFTIDRMKRTLSEFMDEAKNLRGRDFCFIFAGSHLTNVKLDQIDFGVKVDERS